MVREADALEDEPDEAGNICKRMEAQSPNVCRSSVESRERRKVRTGELVDETLVQESSHEGRRLGNQGWSRRTRINNVHERQPGGDIRLSDHLVVVCYAQISRRRGNHEDRQRRKDA